MKLVKCQITLHTKEDYRKVIDSLLRIFMSHTASFEAPSKFVVTCYCNHIQAERNLDNVLETLHLQCEKVPMFAPEHNPVQSTDLEGPPAPVERDGKIFLVSPSLKGHAS